MRAIFVSFNILFQNVKNCYYYRKIPNNNLIELTTCFSADYDGVYAFSAPRFLKIHHENRIYMINKPNLSLGKSFILNLDLLYLVY